MKFHLTRMVALMVTFGFLYSCTLVNHFQQAENDKDNHKYSIALESINRVVEREPDNAEAWILRAEILASLARTQNANARTEAYTDMVGTVDRAIRLAKEVNSSELEQRAVQVKSAAFNFEYELAVSFLDKTDSADNPASMLAAVPHLENARFIQPGYEDIYEALIHVYTANNEYEKAISALFEIKDISGFDAFRHERLGFLYYQMQDYERAIEQLQISWMSGRGSSNSGRGLANAFKKLNDFSSEREILEQLSEMEPDNIYHHIALGKNLAAELAEIILTLKSEGITPSVREQAEQLFSEIERVESVFIRAVQIEEEHILANLSTGLYLRNTAFLLKLESEFLNSVLEDDELSAKTDDLLYRSLIYLEKAIELDPYQPFIWAAIWPVYDSLQMSDEAKKAKDKSDN